MKKTENQNVAENAVVDTPVEQEAPATENDIKVTETRRKIKLQSPFAVVMVPKKEKKQKTSTEEPAAEEKPKEKGEKLKKVKRIAGATGLIVGAALVGLGSYLKRKDDGATDFAHDLVNSMNEDSQEGEPEPDPAGVSKESDAED